MAAKIATQTELESEMTLDYGTFADYFDVVHARVPARCARPLRVAPPGGVPRPVVAAAFWVLDFRRRAVYRLSSPPPDTASIVTVDEAVLADAIAKRLMHVVHGSMRISVHLRPGGAGDDLTFWGLLVPWELGYVPLHRIAAAPAVRGHVAAPVRVVGVGRFAPRQP